MKKKRKSKKFPYIVEAPMVDKILCLLFIPFYLLLLQGAFNRWNIVAAQDKYSYLAVTLALSIAFLTIIFKVFFAKSVLENKWITRTNVFLMKRRIRYEEINDVRPTINNRGVKLNLVDGSSVKFYCGDIVEALNVMRLINKKIRTNKQQSFNNGLNFHVP